MNTCILLGAREAKGTVLVFLDSHCECGPGWLQPLLHALAQDERKVSEKSDELWDMTLVRI